MPGLGVNYTDEQFALAVIEKAESLIGKAPPSDFRRIEPTVYLNATDTLPKYGVRKWLLEVKSGKVVGVSFAVYLDSSQKAKNMSFTVLDYAEALPDYDSTDTVISETHVCIRESSGGLTRYITEYGVLSRGPPTAYFAFRLGNSSATSVLAFLYDVNDAW
jgi:hypothetical protein